MTDTPSLPIGVHCPRCGRWVKPDPEHPGEGEQHFCEPPDNPRAHYRPADVEKARRIAREGVRKESEDNGPDLDTEKLADEAERGYDPATIVPRRADLVLLRQILAALEKQEEFRLVISHNLHRPRGPRWAVGATFGREEPDNPDNDMVGGASYGMGETLVDALRAVSEQVVR